MELLSSYLRRQNMVVEYRDSKLAYIGENSPSVNMGLSTDRLSCR